MEEPLPSGAAGAPDAMAMKRKEMRQKWLRGRLGNGRARALVVFRLPLAQIAILPVARSTTCYLEVNVSPHMILRGQQRFLAT